MNQNPQNSTSSCPFITQDNKFKVLKKQSKNKFKITKFIKQSTSYIVSNHP